MMKLWVVLLLVGLVCSLAAGAPLNETSLPSSDVEVVAKAGGGLLARLVNGLEELLGVLNSNLIG